MITEYIHYAKFDEAAQKQVNLAHYHAFKHLLPKVDVFLRQRFLLTLNATLHIATSKVLLENSKNLPDINYDRYLRYMLAKQ